METVKLLFSMASCLGILLVITAMFMVKKNYQKHLLLFIVGEILMIPNSVIAITEDKHLAINIACTALFVTIAIIFATLQYSKGKDSEEEVKRLRATIEQLKEQLE